MASQDVPIMDLSQLQCTSISQTKKTDLILNSYLK